ncbi:MAG TPA: hypothetical protein VE291_12350 [Terracidiphilus sp.]|nr:hypothetical protein [Terracidiphilus sp.]
MSTGLARSQPVRGTQKLVDQMGWVFHRPALVGLEIAWRWLFGLPFLWVCMRQMNAIMVALPPDSTALANLDSQNPWIAASQLSSAWARYQPHAVAVLAWLAPAAALAWIIVSGFGRAALFVCLERGVRFRPVATMALQAAWLVVFVVVCGGWFRCMQWVAATHIAEAAEPDLIGFAIWTIFLTLGFFTLWALVSWPFAVAPILMLKEERSAVSALAASFRLGRVFNSKLMETNLVMGIVKLALIVLAMVFSAAPLPFSDQLGPEALHVVAAGAVLFYFVSSDYFHVVRLKGYVEFWRALREEPLKKS